MAGTAVWALAPTQVSSFAWFSCINILMATCCLFGALLVGGNKLNRTVQVVQVPASMTTVLIGLVIIFVVGSDIFIRRRTRRRVSVSTSEAPAEPAGVKVSP